MTRIIAMYMSYAKTTFFILKVIYRGYNDFFFGGGGCAITQGELITDMTALDKGWNRLQFYHQNDSKRGKTVMDMFMMAIFILRKT